jgi:hypothetical protein
MENTIEVAKLSCRRKVKLKSKTKLCGCPDSVCPLYEDRDGKKHGGYCPNCCVDTECSLHNTYMDYGRRK